MLQLWVNNWSAERAVGRGVTNALGGAFDVQIAAQGVSELPAGQAEQSKTLNIIVFI